MAILRVGILGVGQRGLQHLRELWAMHAEGLVQLTALCDAWADNLNTEKIRSFVPDYRDQGIGTYVSCETMLAADVLDVLYVCLPPGVHDGEVVAAAQAGIHVFVEKPMSLYYDEAREMEQAINTSGVLSTAGFQQRYDIRNEVIHDFFEDRKIVMMTSTNHGFLEGHSIKHTHTEEVGGPSNRVWTANFAWSGSAVVEGGIHTVDLMRYWCGDIDWVQSVYVPRDESDIENDGDNPYVCVANFGFRNGAVGTLHISRLRRVYHSAGNQMILWDHGHLMFEPEGPVAYYYDGPYPPSERPNADMLRHPVPVPDRNDALHSINRVFITAIAEARPELIKSPFSEAMNSLSAVLAANVSHERGGERIDLKRFAADDVYQEYRVRR